MKIDFRKAYDSVRFLDHIFLQVGLGLRMRKWINWCVRTTSISIMVNGSPTKPFKIEKGLR